LFRIATLKKLWKKEGVNVDNATLNRWVISYSPTIAVKATSQKRETNKEEGIISKIT
jgi:transposase-like protein